MSQALVKVSLTPVDTWFFRESRAHDTVGVDELGSMFPPSARTVLGALRTLVGDEMGVDWGALTKGASTHDVESILGTAAEPGSLRLLGLQLAVNGDPLFPCPADLLAAEHQNARVLSRLRPGKAIRCDIGTVRLPALDAGAPEGSRPPGQAWLTIEGMTQWLAGLIPESRQLVMLDDLLVPEPRLGIARDNRRGTVERGLLYQTRHLRAINERLTVEAWVTGLPDEWHERLPHRGTLRLGGEGRAAGIYMTPATQVTLPAPPDPREATGLTAVLTTPGLVARQDSDAGLPGFTRATAADGSTCWDGEIGGMEVRMVSSCRGRAMRLGGWDQRARKPMPVRSFVPPGTVWFLEPRDPKTSYEACLEAIHGQELTPDTGWGYGRIFAGISR